MTSFDDGPPPGSAAEQADYWLTLLHSPFVTEAAKQAFLEWLQEKPENRAAWQQAQAFWQMTDALNKQQIQELERRLIPAAATGPALSKSFFTRHARRTLPVFACLILVAIAGYWNMPYFLADFRTAAGEQRSLQLADGSDIIMNTASAISVDFSETRRIVTLHKGQAYFQVAPDSARPFEVVTDIGRVQALGTAFDIRQAPDELTVTVFQHAVNVTVSGSSIPLLPAGKRAAYKDGKSFPVTTADLKLAGAWREHRMVFKDRPLSEVVNELNRYRNGRIVLIGSELTRLKVTGVFDPRDTETALAAIEQTLSIEEYRFTDRLIFLSAQR